MAERLKRKTKSGGEVHVASDSPKASSVDEQVRTDANDAVASDSQVKSAVSIEIHLAIPYV